MAHYNYARSLMQNVKDLFTERNTLSGRVDNTNSALATTNATVEENEVISDETILDLEERVILLEVGE